MVEFIGPPILIELCSTMNFAWTHIGSVLFKLIPEYLRLIQPLQESDKAGFSTPDRWKPDEGCIIPCPGTTAEVEMRLKSEYKVVDWYFSPSR